MSNNRTIKTVADVDPLLIEVLDAATHGDSGRNLKNAAAIVNDFFEHYPFLQTAEEAEAVHTQLRKVSAAAQEKQRSLLSLEDLANGLQFLQVPESCGLAFAVTAIHNALAEAAKIPRDNNGSFLFTCNISHAFSEDLLPEGDLPIFDLKCSPFVHTLMKFGSYQYCDDEALLLKKSPQLLARQLRNALMPYTTIEAAEEFGRKLSFALCEPEHPPLMVLHSEPHQGTRNALKEMQTIFSDLGFKPLEIEGRRFNSYHEESYPLFGSPTFWSGSRPGMLTEFVYNNPKALVIIHDADKMNPIMFSSLEKVFTGDNIAMDEHGLTNRGRDRRDTAEPTTPVDFSQTVFIFTTTAGYSLYDRLARLKTPPTREMMFTHVYSALESARFQRRHTDDAVFNPEFLQLMNFGLIPLPPVPFKNRVAHESKALHQELQRQSEQLQATFEATEEACSALTAALLLSHHHNKLSLEALAKDVLCKPFMQNHHSAILSIEVDPQVVADIEPFLDMPAPQSYLEKRGKTLRPLFADRNDGVIALQALVEEKRYRQNEHEGSISLMAEYPTTRFSDIHGHHWVKKKMVDIIDHLQRGDVPNMQRGLLLAGEPGVGKTMLAAAFAGEAQMAFINLTGSELLFLDGINRLQMLLENHSPCVVFIDEADSIPSRALRSELTPAVNRLLSLVQGINTDQNEVFWILASNFPENLDPALLRAGRIEETIHLSAPKNAAERKEYLQDFPINKTHLIVLAELTDGFTGAMFAQLKRKIELQRRRAGSIKKNDLYTLVSEVRYGDTDPNFSRPADMEKRIAYHEAGHAVAQLCLGREDAHLMLVLHNSETVGGFLQTTNDDQDSLQTPTLVQNRLAVTLAGRAAEQLFFEEISMGCTQDLQTAGEIAYSYASKAGFVPDITGLYVSPLASRSKDMTARYEQAASDMVTRAWEQSLAVLTEQKTLLTVIAEKLLSKRLLNNDELRQLYQKHGV